MLIMSLLHINCVNFVPKIDVPADAFVYMWTVKKFITLFVLCRGLMEFALDIILLQACMHVIWHIQWHT